MGISCNKWNLKMLVILWVWHGNFGPRKILGQGTQNSRKIWFAGLLFVKILVRTWNNYLSANTSFKHFNASLSKCLYSIRKPE